MFGAAGDFPPPDAPPGYLTRITIEKVGRVSPLGILTAATASVEKPADEDEHAGHHHGHAH
jgi:chaperonin GroEL